MTIEEQQHIRQKGYAEAMRYIANAKDVLQKAGFENGRYKDSKYVRMACGTAYNGVLDALDVLGELRNVNIPKGDERKNIQFYRDILKYNKKLQTYLDNVYKHLHLNGYYEGNLNSSKIKPGFKYANELISLIKPEAA
jgi:hypothetical protein